MDGTFETSFEIIDSELGDRLHTMVPLDLAICQDCINEVRSASDWRGEYPFITCAHCGPRYSILRSMPFDRATTTMDAFPMCPRCEAEYRDPHDRRYHAQTVCCPDCGPQCWATDNRGEKLASPVNAVELIAARISAGAIAAVKGIGGYQLICDATNHESVKSLRRRKCRPCKPLPIMVRDLTMAQQLASIDDAESRELRNSAGSIVLLRAIDQIDLSPLIAPKLDTIGVMLPPSALHVLLADRVGRPLVVTSGNGHGSPLIYQNEIAGRELSTIADVFLHHDREITHPIDDSVVQCVEGNSMTLRAARGIAPLAFACSSSTTRLATGGHQKVATAIQTCDALVLAPHVGDMETESSRIRFSENQSKLCSLYQVDPAIIVHDHHPNYFTTDWAIEQDFPRKPIQHHHAHVAAAMLEHDLLDQLVLGIAFDGTGYGDDGTIWGGEALLSTTANFQRVGYLRPFRLPSGEMAIKQPWRIAASIRSQLGIKVNSSLQYAIDHGPLNSSMGRLFDGIAAIVLGIDSVNEEGEAAMRLESSCDQSETSSYQFSITTDEPIQFDWRQVLDAISADLGHVSAGRIAMRFHRAVAMLVCRLAERYKAIPCVLSGGVFQNRVLLELIASVARERRLDIRMPGRIPINDGGLAIGQLVIARQGVTSCA
jgi:hydrogenase maturation protein HypF